MITDEKEASKAYNFMANQYHDLRTKKYPGYWMYNELLEVPSTIELLGNVNGKKILDFGCGSGIYTKNLTKRGAIIKGFDISEEMLKIAKAENPGLDLRLGSGYKIPFDEKFDIVFASLVLDYFSNWDKAFKQVKKVLKKGGFFIFSIGNPVSECTKKIKIRGQKLRVLGKISYFDEKKLYATWKNIRGKNIKVVSNHKTYETIIKTILKNDFEIVDYKDCFPLEKAKKLFPQEYAFTSKFPYFCAWKVKLK
ncbi:class I SAM-dependent methyltransferase [Candidatus Pacearchaeota archaeon]|nr:class I SAM-dependent methyltransferase [Candidatus Pacearchaeota archaeon]